MMGQRLCWMRSGHRLWYGYIKGGTVELFNADSSRVGGFGRVAMIVATRDFHRRGRV